MATGFRRLGNGDGGVLVKDAIAKVHAAHDALVQAKAMASAVLARGTAAEMEGAEFGAQSGEGQAVHDEVHSLADALSTFMDDNAILLARFNPGG
ncbi:hypothetical protein D9623_33540 (plasmid) [Azospirillum brasilense]|uniref:Uncharacterized protein n=1 Tax=Azospirillum brasilense TaxID=192 RepID=A0A4D8R0S9_AZOBR|nr:MULTISPECIES: hypothetical protein [Azospirillum]YP_001686893.1 hypothetical protein APCd_gp52 [Azospirillum phage Cd]MDW7555364.1 hypothetical protein [Azospirillum brasilense]MDW7595228.1 hypothetical protein [Azospirillum brasilense]MDW7630382.1 hypothetical protein [Azospirillum brasilense]MDX5949749.1 hypothetical protein [Azospirillum brasilense]OPH16879.1 hypothetical protein FE89_02670 [Azospirillum brasilense]